MPSPRARNSASSGHDGPLRAARSAAARRHRPTAGPLAAGRCGPRGALRRLPMARRYGAQLTVHGQPDLAEACRSDGVHLPAGADAAQARKILGREKLLGVSLHTVTEAEAIDPAIVDYAIA